jgi:hypothetical protein
MASVAGPQQVPGHIQASSRTLSSRLSPFTPSRSRNVLKPCNKTNYPVQGRESDRGLGVTEGETATVQAMFPVSWCLFVDALPVLL